MIPDFGLMYFSPFTYRSFVSTVVFVEKVHQNTISFTYFIPSSKSPFQFPSQIITFFPTSVSSYKLPLPTIYPHHSSGHQSSSVSPSVPLSNYFSSSVPLSNRNFGPSVPLSNRNFPLIPFSPL